MTCIAAVTDGIRVAMAADSLAVDSCGQIMGVEKLVEYPGPVLVGVAGRVRTVPVLRRLQPGEPLDADEADAWAQGFADQATEALVGAGVTHSDNNRSFFGTLLLAWRDRIWEVETGAALPVTRGYHAVGSGDQVAAGALWAMDGDRPLEERARLAVEASIEHQVDVGGPVVVRST